MPKHLLLGMTLRNLTGSAELLTLINHFGHVQSNSRISKLETAVCGSINIRDTVLSPTISSMKWKSHIWDTFDLNEEDPSGL